MVSGQDDCDPRLEPVMTLVRDWLRIRALNIVAPISLSRSFEFWDSLTWSVGVHLGGIALSMGKLDYPVFPIRLDFKPGEKSE